MGKTGRTISDSTPLVADLPRAAYLLGLERERLEAAVTTAQLRPWGENAQGMPVYRWPELLEAADAAGLPVPEQRRGHGWRRHPAVRRVAPYGAEK